MCYVKSKLENELVKIEFLMNELVKIICRIKANR